MHLKHLCFQTKLLTDTDTDTEQDLMTFRGYAAYFNNTDDNGDIIEVGAFKEFLRDVKKTNRWPVLLAQHGSWLGGDDNTPIGVITKLEEDDKGLVLEGKLANTPRGQEMYSLMKMEPRPAITGMSIGYTATEYVNVSEDGARRRLKKIKVWEVSLVSIPANDLARVSDVKSARTTRDAERALRDAGFSRSDAKAIVANGFKAIDQWDAETVDECATAIKGLMHKIKP